MKETNVMKTIQLDLAYENSTLFRNNCGAWETETGAWVRYGVGNPGGSDLIGITPITITQDMVGHKVGVFTAIEVKKPKNKKQKKEQIDFINVIKMNGGIGAIARSTEQALLAIKKYFPIK